MGSRALAMASRVPRALMGLPRPAGGEHRGGFVHRHPRLATLLHEAPWLLAAALGVVVMVQTTGTLQHLYQPFGQAWNDYLLQAHRQLHGPLEGYQSAIWPLYPYLLGALGEGVGYVPAARLLAFASFVGMTLAAGLGARALAGPWAGALAAAALTHTAVMPDVARWINLYPLLGALTGLALACALAWVRWPRCPWAWATGILGALAWATDWRGAAIIPGLVLLALLGLSAPMSWRRRLLALLGFGLLALGPFIKDLSPLEITPWSMGLVGELQSGALRDATGVRDLLAPAHLAALLEPLRHLHLLSPATEHRRLFQSMLPFSWRWTLLLSPLLLLPGRQGARSWAAGLVTALVALAFPIGFMALSALTMRYLVQGWVPLAMLVPVAAGRLLHTLLPRRLTPWVAAPAMVALGISGTQPDLDAPLESRLGFVKIHALLDGLHGRMEADDRLLDCAWSGIEVALLPRALHDPGGEPLRIDWATCNRWRMAPPSGPGAAWLVAFQESREGLPQRSSLQRNPSWNLIFSIDAHPPPALDVWRWQEP